MLPSFEPRSYRVSIATAIFAVALLSGCTRSSFLGRQFDDLTAHYNTYYNANRTFNEQEKRLKKKDTKIDMDLYLLVFEVPEVRGRSAEFEKVIEKSADLLRKHAQSKWVDDALMLIGKSYFYQTNYVGAEQKFTEVVALDGPKFDEAAFWLARTLVAAQSEQAAEDVIRTALSSERLHKKWRPHFYLLLGDLRAYSQDWEGAIQALEISIPDIQEGDLTARAQFLLGQLYETVEDYPASIAAYEDVQKYKPLYELSFAAMYSQFRVEGRYRDPEAALAGLQKMQRDNKHYQYIDRIVYNSARVHAAMGDVIAARRLYLQTLYPPSGRPASSIRGEVHYRLAELHRDILGDFYGSAAHFDTASSILRTTRLQNAQYAPDAITNARAIADIFSTYREVLEDVQNMDSLLYLGTLDDEAFDEAVREVRQQLALEAARAAEELRRRQTESSFRTSEGNEARDRNRPTGVDGNQQRQRFGFLNHKDIQRVQGAFLNFRRVWGDRPLIPGWRREEVVLSTRSSQQDELDKVDGPVREQAVSGTMLAFLPPVDISDVPRDSLSQAEMRSTRAAARYKLANVLFLSMSLPDSAAYWYRMVIDEDSGEPVALRAQYAMAEVYVAVGDEDSAEKLFSKIIRRDPESVFADRARVSLGIEITTESVDSLEIALDQYSHAYELWNVGEPRPALNAMVRTAADNPRSDIAAKAMLAAAAIFSEMAQVDSVDLFGVIPLGDSIFTVAELDLARKELEPEILVDSGDSLVSPDTVARESTPKPDPQGLETSGSEPAVSEFDPPTLESEMPDQQSVLTGEPLVRDDDPIRRPTIDDDFKRNVRDEDAGPKIEPMEVDSLESEDAEPIVESEEDVPRSEFTEANPEGENAPQPAPEKPDWITPEYFVNLIIPQPLTLHSLLVSIETNFPGTDYGARASDLKRGLIAYRDEYFARPDTPTQVVEPEALGVISTSSVADTTLVVLDQ